IEQIVAVGRRLSKRSCRVLLDERYQATEAIGLLLVLSPHLVSDRCGTSAVGARCCIVVWKGLHRLPPQRVVLDGNGRPWSTACCKWVGHADTATKRIVGSVHLPIIDTYALNRSSPTVADLAYRHRLWATVLGVADARARPGMY